MNRLLGFLSVFFLSAPAWAQPSSGLPGLLDLQGHLRTENGQPVNKTVSLRVALYDASSGGNLLYSEDVSLVPVVGGRFSVRIGAVSALPVDLFVARSAVFVGITVDGAGELPRQQLVPVAYAFKASHAARASLADLASGLDCQACVDGTRLADEAVTGNKILDGSIGTSELSGGAVTASKLGEPCALGEILKKKPGGWACAADADSTYSGADFALSNQLCETGQLAKGFGPDGLLVCGKDEGTTYMAGNGLVLDGTQFSIKFDVTDARYVNEAQANAITSLMVVDGTIATDDLSDGAVTTSKLADGAVTAAKLGEACKPGEILKKADSGWSCGADGGNAYSGADFALSGQTCAAGHVVKAVGPDGLLMCVADETGTIVPGPGLVLDGAKLSLPLTCAAGNVLKWNATDGAWDCAADEDTKYAAGLGLKLESATFSVDQSTVVGWAKAACFDTNDEVLAVVASAGYLNKSDKLVEGQMPANGLNEVSNGLITNQFADSVSSTKAVDIPDNNPVGVSDTIAFPDIGIAEKLTVSVDISTSNVTQIKVFLYDPNSVEYKLHEMTYNPDSTVKKLVTSYPDPTAPVSGNLATWVGKNPVGPWRIKVIDTQYLNNTFDGKINAWSVNIQTLSSKKVQIAGDLGVTGKVTTGGDVTVGGKLTVVGQPVAAVWTAESDALGDGKTLDLNTGTSSPLLIAQAWFQQDDGSWLQASTAADVQTIGGCSACGDGSNGDYTAVGNVNLAGGTYNFRSFTVAQGAVVTVTGTTPLTINVQGDVVIDGTIDLRGKNGAAVTSQGTSAGGAGGGGGGGKGGDGVYGYAGTNGEGSGGGSGGNNSSCGGGGGGAGHQAAGTSGGTCGNGCSCGSVGNGGPAYNDALLSQGLKGGSGGGAGGYGAAANSQGGGGGGGGGAIKITAMKITIGATGAILADGGAGGPVNGDYDGGGGGGGSGGTIWLRGSTITIVGQVTAKGGAGGIANQSGSYWGGNGGAGSAGRIRLDGQVAGTTTPTFVAGDTNGLSPLVVNKFLITQPTAGLVRLTNKSGKTQKVKLVIMK